MADKDEVVFEGPSWAHTAAASDSPHLLAVFTPQGGGAPLIVKVNACADFHSAWSFIVRGTTADNKLVKLLGRASRSHIPATYKMI